MMKLEKKTHFLIWVSSEEIAQRLGVHRSSVYHLVAKAKNLPSLVMPPWKKGSKRPRKIGNTLKAFLKGR
jgi:transposase